MKSGNRRSGIVRNSVYQGEIFVVESSLAPILNENGAVNESTPEVVVDRCLDEVQHVSPENFTHCVVRFPGHHGSELPFSVDCAVVNDPDSEIESTFSGSWWMRCAYPPYGLLRRHLTSTK